jgi:hypothetical protein
MLISYFYLEIFELQSFGTSIVRIKHNVTGLFITMNSKGRLKGQVTNLSSVTTRATAYILLITAWSERDLEVLLVI